MGGIRGKLALAAALAGFAFLLVPAPANATVTGGCTVTGDATVSGQTDLTTTDIWHLKTADQVTGSAEYPTQTYVHVDVYLFGYPYQIYETTGKDTHGSAGPFAVSDYSRYTRVFAAGGTSDTCDGSVLIIVDDQSWFTTIFGLVGIVLTLIGLIVLLALGFLGGGSGGCGSIVIGALAGLLLGLGGSVSAMEAGLVDPRNYAGAVIIGVGILIGLATPIIRGRISAPPAPPAP